MRGKAIYFITTLQKEKKMKRLLTVMLVLGVFCLAAGIAAAQSQPVIPDSDLLSKSTKAVGYQVGGGSTMIDLKGTNLMPQAAGEAKVEAKTGVTNIEVKVNGMGQPSKLGTEFLTFVLWAVSPDGRTGNIGEIQTDKDGKGELKTTVQSQTFSLIITAEPYLAVRQPSELVVLENDTRKGTKGKIFPVNDYKLMKRAQYQKMGNPMGLSLDLKNVPLEMYEARNAVEIAKDRKADKYAGEIFSKAEASLKMAENALAGKKDKKEIISTARQTIQFSEDARALSVQRQEAERIAKEKADAAAQAKAAAEAKRRADAEAARQAELTAAREAQMKAEAEAAAVKAKAEQDAIAAKERQAREAAERSEQEKQALRASLLEQLNRILDTRDTDRGLVVNMADVLFDTGKYTLRQETREKLARLSGVVLAHPGLKLEVEGHTDSTGSDEFNQKLSEQRASTTRGYLIEQGLPEGNITAKGYGKTMPVADNSTAAGRQKNRRVEIIVSGDVIGMKVGK
jgi:outer membrane protein OmpA-like peptidoglycan-associated protein